MLKVHWIAVTCVLCGCGGLGRHAELLVSDAQATQPVAAGSVRVTYLGCNGYLLEASDAAVLVDPYFSRISSSKVVFDRWIAPDVERIEAGMIHAPRIGGILDAILVTHGHFDHLMDVPVLAARSQAMMVASRSSCLL